VETQLYNAAAQKENGTKLGGSLIRQGELVAFPTETVYGLGADGLNPGAVNRIFEVKGRPNDNPLILHVARKSDARRLWREVTPVAMSLMDAFWPGPLTLVCRKQDCVPDEVTAGLPTVAVRMPDHKTALALIRAADTPIAAPSANLSGRPSPTTAKHVLADLDGLIPLVLDAGPCRVGVESTVVSLVGAPTVLRPGIVTPEMLEAVIGPVELSPALTAPLAEGSPALSPGMKHEHYSPGCPVIVVRGEQQKAARRILWEYENYAKQGKECAILATQQTRSLYRAKTHVVIGDRERPETLCQNLFAALRGLSGKTDVILAEGIPASAAGLAFMNRLLRAAGFTTIDV